MRNESEERKREKGVKYLGLGGQNGVVSESKQKLEGPGETASF